MLSLPLVTISDQVEKQEGAAGGQSVSPEAGLPRGHVRGGMEGREPRGHTVLRPGLRPSCPVAAMGKVLLRGGEG